MSAVAPGPSLDRAVAFAAQTNRGGVQTWSYRGSEGRVQEPAINYPRWARDTASPRRLGRAQRAVLTQLALRADRRGRCHPSIARIADDAGYGESTVKRALMELEQLKLVTSTRRGRRPSVRQLCPDAPIPAAPCPRGTPSMFDADLQPARPDLVTGRPPAVQPPDPPEVSSAAVVVSPTRPRSLQSEETTEGNARCALETTSDRGVREVPFLLQPRLDDVLGVLGTAPGLVIEPLAVNSALGAHPESSGHDHLSAAFTVASWAFEGGLRHSAANRLLLAALRSQTRTPAAAAGAGRPPWHEGRARRAASAPVSTGGYMRED